MARKKEKEDIKTKKLFKRPQASTVVIRESRRGRVGNTVNSYISQNFFPKRIKK